MKTKITFTHLDKDFNLIGRQEQPMRSWLLQLFGFLYLRMANLGPTMLDITNTSRTTANGYSYGRPGMIAAVGGSGTLYTYLVGTVKYGYLAGSKLGIIVGTDNSAASPSDYALGARISHGHSAGTLNHGGTEVTDLSVANPNGSFIIRRYFTNNSGGDVTVEECGIYTSAIRNNNLDNDYYCIARDVVAPAVVVANTEILVVTYTVQITV
jgi:hypothetical protein